MFPWEPRVKVRCYIKKYTNNIYGMLGQNRTTISVSKCFTYFYEPHQTENKNKKPVLQQLSEPNRM